MRANVIGMGVADKDALATANALVRIQPQTELRQMNPGAGKLDVQRHAGSVGGRRRESNVTTPSFKSLFAPRLV